MSTSTCSSSHLAAVAKKPKEQYISNTENASNKNKKASRMLPTSTIEYLKAWMMSDEHIDNPYPTEQEKQKIMIETGIGAKQLTNWFTNNRTRYWKPRVGGVEQNGAQGLFTTKTKKGGRKSTLLPTSTVEYLKAWMMSDEHIDNPYPTEQEKQKIMIETGIGAKQLTNWFTNNRKRYWKPRVGGVEQNGAQGNDKKKSNNSSKKSGYTGVYWSDGGWKVVVTYKSQRIYAGQCALKADGAYVWDEATKALKGSNRKANFGSMKEYTKAKKKELNETDGLSEDVSLSHADIVARVSAIVHAASMGLTSALGSADTSKKRKAVVKKTISVPEANLELDLVTGMVMDACDAQESQMATKVIEDDVELGEVEKKLAELELSQAQTKELLESLPKMKEEALEAKNNLHSLQKQRVTVDMSIVHGQSMRDRALAVAMASLAANKQLEQFAGEDYANLSAKEKRKQLEGIMEKEGTENFLRKLPELMKMKRLAMEEEVREMEIRNAKLRGIAAMYQSALERKGQGWNDVVKILHEKEMVLGRECVGEEDAAETLVLDAREE